MSALKFEEYQNFDQIKHLRKRWNEIVQREGLGPAHSFDWCKILWESHWDSKDIILLVIYKDQEVVGFAPMRIEVERKMKTNIRTLQSGTNVFSLHGSQFIFSGEKEEPIEAVLDWLLDSKYQWDHWVMVFEENDKQSSIFESLLKKKSIGFTKRSGDRSPYLRLEGSWKEYLAGRSGNLRSVLKRRERKLREKGDLVFTLLDKTNDCQNALDSIYEIENESWKKTAGTAITLDPHQMEFYKRYLDFASKDSILKLALLSLNGEPMAYDFAVYQNGVYYMLKTSYKEKFRQDAAGVVLRKFVIEWLYEDKAKEIDLLGKDEVWKMKWASGIRNHMIVTIFNRTIRGWLMHAKESLGAAFARSEDRVTDQRE